MPFLYVVNESIFFDPKLKNKSILWKDHLEPIHPEEGEWDTGEGEKAKNNDNRSDRRVVLLLIMMLIVMVMMMTKTVTVAFCCSCGISQYTSCRWATGSHTTSVYKIIFLLFYFVCYFGFVLSFIFCFAFLGFVLIPLVWSTISLCDYHVPTFEYFIASTTTPYVCCIFYKTHTWSTVILKIAQMGYIQRNTFLRHSW